MPPSAAHGFSGEGVDRSTRNCGRPFNYWSISALWVRSWWCGAEFLRSSAPLLKLRRYGREDLEWCVRALSMGMRIAVVREPIYFYRQGNGRQGEAEALHQRQKLHDFAIKRYLCAKFKKPLGLSERFCRKYIAGGYRIAARAHAKRGETGKTIWKALGAMWTDPGIANVRFVLRMLAEGVAGEEYVESWMAHLRRQ